MKVPYSATVGDFGSWLKKDVVAILYILFISVLAIVGTATVIANQVSVVKNQHMILTTIEYMKNNQALSEHIHESLTDEIDLLQERTKRFVTLETLLRETNAGVDKGVKLLDSRTERIAAIDKLLADANKPLAMKLELLRSRTKRFDDIEKKIDHILEQLKAMK